MTGFRNYFYHWACCKGKKVTLDLVASVQQNLGLDLGTSSIIGPEEKGRDRVTFDPMAFDEQSVDWIWEQFLSYVLQEKGSDRVTLKPVAVDKRSSIWIKELLPATSGYVAEKLEFDSCGLDKLHVKDCNNYKRFPSQACIRWEWRGGLEYCWLPCGWFLLFLVS